MGQTLDTYYSQSAKSPANFPSLVADKQADICIIGGGLAGLATACGLIERGQDVCVLEGRCIGYGASGRNGGFVLAGFAAPYNSIARKIGRDNAKTLIQASRDAQKLIRLRIKDYTIDCAPVDGHLVASFKDDPQSMRNKAAFFGEELGIECEYWDETMVRDICRTESYFQGAFFPDYFHMQVLDYQHGIARAIKEKGGQIYEQSMVTSIDYADGYYTLSTDGGSIRARQIVHCQSAYSNNVHPKLTRSCLPVSTYVMVTKPIDEAILKAVIKRPYAIRDTRFADDYYRILPDNRILWGGRVGLGPKVPTNLENVMLGDLLAIYPSLEGHVQADYAWGGLMGYSVHKMPHIGELRKGEWMCTHFGGNGVGPTTAGGEIIASAIAEDDTRHKLFEPFGFAWTGGPAGPFIAKAVYKSWEIADWWQHKTVLSRRRTG